MSDSEEALSTYEEKRDFRKTPERSKGEIDVDWAEERPMFVIQKHDASGLHYDLRLEVEGALKSWAVPKGPSTDPSERRLAMATENHPLAYADFEGVIPEDTYDGGTVLVWDRGSYRNLKEAEEGEEKAKSVAQQLKEGHATVWLEGQKLQGGYALIRTRKGDDPRWLLIKMRDEETDARRNPTSTEPESVRTGRTLEEIREEEGERDG